MLFFRSVVISILVGRNLIEPWSEFCASLERVSLAKYLNKRQLTDVVGIMMVIYQQANKTVQASVVTPNQIIKCCPVICRNELGEQLTIVEFLLFVNGYTLWNVKRFIYITKIMARYIY